MMQKAMAANGAMAFLELYLEDDCTNHSGNKVMDVQHNNLVTGEDLVQFE